MVNTTSMYEMGYVYCRHCARFIGRELCFEDKRGYPRCPFCGKKVRLNPVKQ